MSTGNNKYITLVWILYIDIFGGLHIFVKGKLCLNSILFSFLKSTFFSSAVVNNNKVIHINPKTRLK